MIAEGQSFSKRYVFTADGIRAFARIAEDNNPLHHDREAASRTRFGGLIACGAHSTGVFASLCAEHFSANYDTVGLEFTFALRRAVPEGLASVMMWTITAIEPSEKLKGRIATVEGAITDDDGRVYITGRGTVLVSARGAFAANVGARGLAAT